MNDSVYIKISEYKCAISLYQSVFASAHARLLLPFGCQAVLLWCLAGSPATVFGLAVILLGLCASFSAVLSLENLGALLHVRLSQLHAIEAALQVGPASVQIQLMGQGTSLLCKVTAPLCNENTDIKHIRPSLSFLGRFTHRHGPFLAEKILAWALVLGWLGLGVNAIWASS